MIISTGQDEYAAAQRSVARRLHPDLGGDPQEYLAAMAALDRAYAQSVGTDREHSGAAEGRASGLVHVVHRARVRSLLRTRTRRALRTVKSVLPRSVGGAHRYGRL